MKFSELVRLLEKNGFRIVKEKGVDPVLWEARLATADSGELPRPAGSAMGNVSQYSQGGRLGVAYGR